MASLAEVLNSVGTENVAPPPVGGSLSANAPSLANPSYKRTLLGSTWLRDAVDYVADTDMGALSEALMRLNPATAPMYLVRDAQQGKLLENARTMAGALSQVPTDVVAGTVALPGLVDMATKALGGPSLGMQEPTFQAAADIRDFGKSYGDVIAGRSLPEDHLRGTGADMAANWVRTLAGAAIPVPLPKGMREFTKGVKGIDKATEVSGSVLEALTPLTINPTPGRIAANAGAAAVIAPAAEAGVAGYLKGVQDEAGEAAKAADAQATQGAEQAGVIKPVQAGFSTGDDIADGMVAAGLAGVVMFAGYRRGLHRRVADGLTKAVTGYDPADPAYKTTTSFGTRLSQQLSDSRASQNELLERSIGEVGMRNGPEFAARRAEEAAQRTGPGVSTRMESVYKEGKWLDTNITSTPYNDFALGVSQLSKDQRKAMSDALWARQEMDFRAQSVMRGLSNPTGGTNAHNLLNYTVPQLRAIANKGINDPVLGPLMREYWNYNTKAAQYAGQKLRFTSQETRDFTRNNPHFVPTKSEQGSYLDPRPVRQGNIGVGTRDFDELGDALEHHPKYIEEIIRSSEGKAVTRQFIDDMQRLANMGSPTAKNLFGRSGRLGPEQRYKEVAYRDHMGQRKIVEINDSVVADSLRGNGNPTALQLAHGWYSAMSRLYQSGAVGPLSLVGGSLFPLAGAIYQTTAGTVLKRPKGIAMGWGDKLVQSLSGGKASLPGDWLTMTADAFGVRAPLNMAAVSADRMSQALHRSVITNGALAKMMSPQLAEQTAQRLAHWYQQSAMYAMREQGLIGSGTTDVVDRSLAYAANKDPFKAANNLAGLKTGYQFVDDMLRAISVAPSMSIMAMNKNVAAAGPKEAWKVPAAIRNMTGDPAKSGAFRGAGITPNVVNATPWGNIFIQSTKRMGESMLDKKHVPKFMAGIANGIMMPSAALTLWNSAQGPEYVQYQLFERTPDQRASRIYVALPGRPPTEGLEIPVDPWMRPFKLVSEGLAAMYMGLFTGEIYKDENADMAAAMREMLMPSIGQTAGSVFEQTIVPPMLPPVTTVLGAYGVQARGYTDTRVRRENTRTGFIEGTQNDPSQHQVFDYTLPALMEDIFRTIGATGGAALYNYLTEIPADMKQNDKSFGEAAGYQLRNVTQKMADSAGMVSPLLGTFKAVTPTQEASALILKEKLATIKEISDAYSTSMPGDAPRDSIGTKRVGIEAPLGRMPPGPQDAVTANFAMDVRKFYQGLAPYFEELKVYHTKRSQIQGDMTIMPWAKREMLEDQAYNIIALNRRVLQDVMRIEKVLSVQYGRPVSFDNYNKNKSFADQ